MAYFVAMITAQNARKQSTGLRTITETEKRIIERDANEQRALSSELNGRAQIVAALVGVMIALIYQQKIAIEFPVFWVVLIVGAVGMFFLLIPVSFGENYGYPEPAKKWLEYADARVPELAQAGIQADIAEEEIIEGYWRALASAASTNRDANKRKARILKSSAALSIAVIALTIAMDLIF